MKKLYLFIWISFFFFSIEAIAQKNKDAAPNSLDEYYVPHKNSIFNSASSSSSSSTYSDITQAVKFNPFLILRGIAPFYYERYISDAFSVQGGLGLCFQKDIFQVSAVEDFAINSPTTTVDFNDMITGFEFVNGPTLFYALAVRLYFEDYYDEGSYFEIGLRYNTMNLRAKKNSYHNISGSPLVNVRNMSYTLIYGYQLNTGGSLKTVHDFFFGMGMKNISFPAFERDTRLALDEQGNAYTQDTNKNTGERVSMLVPTFIAGYSFGFGF